MTAPWPAFCESADLATELAEFARLTGASIAPQVGPPAGADGDPGWIWVSQASPDAHQVAALAEAARTAGRPVIVCFIDAMRRPLHGFAGDLGLVATWTPAATAGAAALLQAGGEMAAEASMRGLPESVSQRLKGPGHRAKSTAGRLELVHTGLVGWRAPTGDGAVTVGAPDTALQVLEALAAANTVGGHTAPELATAGVRDAVAETLFGPRRLLSDPASKAALAPFGLPLPQEELCSSPSRAASEAARMGFPVRITLASPDLRVWDQPELTVDGVDNAARVRDVFHQLSSLATEHTAGTRILGVTVTGTRLAEALLSVTARPLTDQTSLVELGFADPHGAASSDGTWLPIPTTAAAVERACTRLAGRSLLLGTTAATRQSTCEDLADLLNRLASLLAAFPAELETVRLHPVALLLGGGFEVREAGVQVTDAFARALESA